MPAGRATASFDRLWFASANARVGAVLDARKGLLLILTLFVSATTHPPGALVSVVKLPKLSFDGSSTFLSFLAT